MPSTIGTGLGGSPVPWGVGTRHKNQGYMIIIFFQKSNKFFFYSHVHFYIVESVPVSILTGPGFPDFFAIKNT
jgi:hypothetical protein